MGSSEKRETKREQILDAAYDLFLENSYSSVKILDIANKAGIGKGTFYGYFSSKEDMVLEIIEQRVSHEYDGLEEKLSAIRDIRQKLDFYIDFKLKYVDKYGKYINELQQIFDNVDSETGEKIRQAIFAMIVKEGEILKPVMEEAIENGRIRKMDVDFTTKYLISTIMMYVSHGYSPMGDLQITKEDFFELLYKGLEPRE